MRSRTLVSAVLLTMSVTSASAAEPLVNDVVFLRPADHHGVPLKNGTVVYSDRGFRLENVPEEVAGATYFRFANDLKGSAGIGTTVHLARPATVYLCYDARDQVTAGWVKQLGFRTTGKQMTVGAAAVYPFDIYMMKAEAGTLVLGGNKDASGTGGRCMYGLAFKEVTPGKTPLVSQVGYAVDRGFHGYRCEKDVRVYHDRGFRLKDVPAALEGAVLVPTIQGMRTSTKATVQLTLSAAATVYVAFEKTPPAWVAKDGFARTDTSLTITGFRRMPDVRVRLYARKAEAGPVTLGPNVGAGGRHGAMYFAIVSGTAEQNKLGVRSGVIRPRVIVKPKNPRTVWCDDADRWVATVWAGNPTLGPDFVQGPLKETTAPGALLFLDDGRTFGIVGSAVTVIRDGRQWVFAGVPGVNGHRDGPVSRALFGGISGIAHHNGDLILFDHGNLCFRRLRRGKDGAWTVTTIAGVPGQQGYRDGPAAKALFRQPWNMAVDAAGRVYTFDGNRLRRIAGGKVETLNPEGGDGHQDGPLAKARFRVYPGGGCCIDERGGLILADRINRCIRKIDLRKGMVSTIACKTKLTTYHDGPALLAGMHDSPGYVLYDRVRKCYYTNGVDESCLRRLDGGWLKTLAGLGRDLTGPAKKIGMKWPAVVGIDTRGDLYFRDGGHRGIVRKLSFAGKKKGE